MLFKSNKDQRHEVWLFLYILESVSVVSWLELNKRNDSLSQKSSLFTSSTDSQREKSLTGRPEDEMIHYKTKYAVKVSFPDIFFLCFLKYFLEKYFSYLLAHISLVCVAFLSPLKTTPGLEGPDTTMVLEWNSKLLLRPGLSFTQKLHFSRLKTQTFKNALHCGIFPEALFNCCCVKSKSEFSVVTLTSRSTLGMRITLSWWHGHVLTGTTTTTKTFRRQTAVLVIPLNLLTVFQDNVHLLDHFCSEGRGIQYTLPGQEKKLPPKKGHSF